MDTPARLLRLLALMSTRGSWSGADLAARMEITERTVRRDMSRLRDLGYPIEAVSGPYGGYSLGAGGRLPPLLLDDDEAVAVAVALHGVAQRSAPEMVDAALSALTKLGQVMPASLRERVVALGEVTVGVAVRDRFATGAMGLDALMGLALACRRSERIRFDYLSGGGAQSMRHTEPYRLVSLGRRWYLVAFDVDRADWRTFRVDRIERVRTTGARFVVSDPPDAASLVAEGVALRAYDERSVVRIHAPLERTLDEIAPTIGRCTPDPDDAASTIVELGGDLDWVARFLVSLPLPFEVIEPAALGDELSRLGEHLVATFRT